MKKLFFYLLFGLILYTSYLDLSNGTLHLLNESPQAIGESDIPYEEIVVQPGETVLTVLEKRNGTLPVSIEQALHDFTLINPAIDPMLIQAGKRYKFPVYDNVDN